ncbi:MAG: hypothetical protein GTO30_18965 [Acidobacteria bacterium]|nr:hypothetical protein [Acidobacteriota bacterium]NIM63645.1 hypothetical protein [Acidobacteriota bacterium]NIO59256.1 hypothetical protein [Acidobacteriota bacterium]NIQ85211.1 hypothetical protein [Acidobacteriota bacterium]NIT10966.1 hypothetical protein [Acidobacteriota bacterium]
MSEGKRAAASVGEANAKATSQSTARIDRLQRWLTLAANLGVLAGLVLVILEINQNTQLARAAYRSEGNVVTNQIWATVMGDRVADVLEKSVASPEEITHSDFIVLDAYLFPSLNLIYRDYQLAQEGLYDTADWKASVDVYVHWYLANPFGRAWWDEEAREFFPAEFATYVDRQLALDSRRDHHGYWLAVRARLTEAEADAER